MKYKKKILTFDIETGMGVNGRKADLSIALCTSWKWAHEDKVHTTSILDTKKRNKIDVMEWDRESMIRLHAAMCEADILVAHFGKFFDRKYVNTRFLVHGLGPIPDIPLIDTCLEFRKEFLISSNRLKYLNKFLQLNHQKSENDWPGWWLKVIQHTKQVIKDMIPYNVDDVLATEELFGILIPYLPKLKLYAFAGDQECPKCLSDNLEKRGYYHKAVGTYQRYRCNNCFAWCSGKKNLLIREKK